MIRFVPAPGATFSESGFVIRKCCMREPQTRLFLTLPADLEEAHAMACLEAMCGTADVACLLLEGADGGQAGLVRRAQGLGIAVLTRDDPALARTLGADGVHVTTGARTARQIRQALGEEMIIGGECRGKRHEAMDLGEAGVDYLALDQRFEAGGEPLLEWWAELFVIPVVAFHPVKPSGMAGLARRGADFVRPEENIWTDVARAGAVGAACMRALRGEAEQ